MSLKTKLFAEFDSEMEGLSKMDLGSEEHKTTANVVFGLADRIIELEKIEVEKAEKAKERDLDAELRLKQMEDEKRDRWIRNVITIGTFAGSAALMIWGTVGTWRFDTVATSTSTNGRTILNNLYPKSLRL